MALIIVVGGLTGCGFADFLGDPPVVAGIDVYNRTEMDIVLVAADGERLRVDACGHARDSDFRIDEVRVGASGQYIRAFGVGSDLGATNVTLVERADASESGIPFLGPPPDPLPPCEGDPQVQPGVPLTN